MVSSRTDNRFYNRKLMSHTQMNGLEYNDKNLYFWQCLGMSQ